MRKSLSLLLGLTLLLALVGAGCNGGASPTATSITLNPSGAQAMDQGQTVTISASVVNDSKNNGVTWSLTGPGSLSNQTSLSVVYTAPATVSAPTTATVTATATSNTAVTAQIVVTVNAAPKVKTTSLPAAVQGSAYSAKLESSDGTGAHTWSVASGSLPSWAKLDAAGGMISGTPDTAGTTNFSVAVTDEAGMLSDPQALTLVVNSAVTVTTTTLPEGVVGATYSATLAAKGGTQPYTWTISVGSLPSWAKLDAAGGIIAGTPDAAGTSNFSVAATDAKGTTSADQALSLVVKPAGEIAISTTTLPDGIVSVPYTFTLEASGGMAPYAWSITSGSLPSGTSLDAKTGEISGTPDTEGTASFTVQVKDSQATPAVDSLALTLTIKPESSVNDFELKGQYAFLLQGFDDATGSQFAIVGSFTADGNGKITKGLEDINGPEGYHPELTLTGNYNVGADNRGYATITNSAGKSLTFAFAVGGMDKNNVATSGSLIEFDDTDGKTGRRGTGHLYLQNPNNFNLASIEGPYAFQMVGQNSAEPGSRAVITGVFRADGKGGVTDGDEEYYSSTSSNGSHINFAGMFSTGTNTSSSGRVTLQVLADGDSSQSVFYVVNGGRALGMLAGSGDESGDVGVASGEVVAQASGPFSNASLDGTSVFYNVGLGSVTDRSEVQVGLVTCEGAGSCSVSVEGNDGGTRTADTTEFAYSVAANGRLEDPNSGEVFGYLIDKNKGFLMTSASRAQAIFFEPQTGGPFSSGSISGKYVLGTDAFPVLDSHASSGVASSTGDGKLNLTVDTSHPFRDLSADQSLAFDVTVDTNGRGTDSQNTFIYYMVSPNKVLMMEATSTEHPSISTLENTVNPAPKVVTGSLHPAAVGTAYSVALHASDGTGAYTWSVSSGALPAWAQLDPASGIISGMPNATGTANFSVTVTDGAGLASAPQDLSIVTSAPAALAISTTGLPEGQVGVPYSATLEATGGIQPYTWTIASGSLPSWASFNSAKGAIYGTPNATGTTTFAVIATDSAGTTSAAQELTLVVNPGSGLTINTNTLPNGLFYVAYTAFIPVSGGVPPYTWSFAGGTVPPWAQLDPSSGKISGLPNTTGTWDFGVQVTDSQATPAVATAKISLTIQDSDETNNAELKGQYAFLLKGFDDATGQQFAAIGSFIADGNGLITGGLEDSNGPDGYREAMPFTGHYSVGADNRGYGNFSSPSGFSLRFAFAVGGLNSGSVATSGSMIEFDDTTGSMGRRGSGNFYLQTPSAFDLANIDGPYAFQMTGQTDTAGWRQVVTGAFTADGKGNMTNGDSEIVSGTGNFSQEPFTGTIATTTAMSQFGRVTWEMVTPHGTGHTVSYIIGSKHALVMTTDPELSGNLLSGEVLGQQSSAPFSEASLNGTFVSYSMGLGYIPGHSDVYLTLMTFNGAGGGTFSQDMNDSGNRVTKTGNFKYLVAANGRVEIVDPTSSETGAVAYLVDQNKGFTMNIDPDAAAGFFERQDNGPFSNASISGSYAFGTEAPVLTNQWMVSGVVTSSGDGVVSETLDFSERSGFLLAGLKALPGLDAPFTMTVDSKGRATNVQGPEVWYLISPNKFIGILPSGMDPGIMIFYKTKP